MSFLLSSRLSIGNLTPAELKRLSGRFLWSLASRYCQCWSVNLPPSLSSFPLQVDLPEEGREAAGAAINLPEVFADFDAALPDFNDFDNVSQMAMNQSRIDDITMKVRLGIGSSHLFSP